MVRLHPVVSIILGFIVFEIIYQIALEWFLLLIYVAMVLGGFIATYFAKKKENRIWTLCRNLYNNINPFVYCLLWSECFFRNWFYFYGFNDTFHNRTWRFDWK